MFRRHKYKKWFWKTYHTLSDNQKEMLQELLVEPQTVQQLKEDGYKQPLAIAKVLADKGYAIGLTLDKEKTIKFYGESPYGKR